MIRPQKLNKQIPGSLRPKNTFYVFLACLTEGSQQCLQMPSALISLTRGRALSENIWHKTKPRGGSTVCGSTVWDQSVAKTESTHQIPSPHLTPTRGCVFLLKGFIKIRADILLPDWGHISSAEVARGSGLAQLTEHTVGSPGVVWH